MLRPAAASRQTGREGLQPRRSISRGHAEPRIEGTSPHGAGRPQGVAAAAWLGSARRTGPALRPASGCTGGSEWKWRQAVQARLRERAGHRGKCCNCATAACVRSRPAHLTLQPCCVPCTRPAVPHQAPGLLPPLPPATAPPAQLSRAAALPPPTILADCLRGLRDPLQEADGGQPRRDCRAHHPCRHRAGPDHGACALAAAAAGAGVGRRVLGRCQHGMRAEPAGCRCLSI